MTSTAPPPDLTKTDADVDATFQELTQGLGEENPPTCEFVYNCPIHGQEPCTYRARWVAVMKCKPHRRRPCEYRILVCDPCHDEIVADGNETARARVVEWLPL